MQNFDWVNTARNLPRLSLRKCSKRHKNCRKKYLCFDWWNHCCCRKLRRWCCCWYVSRQCGYTIFLTSDVLKRICDLTTTSLFKSLTLLWSNKSSARHCTSGSHGWLAVLTTAFTGLTCAVHWNVTFTHRPAPLATLLGFTAAGIPRPHSNSWTWFSD